MKKTLIVMATLAASAGMVQAATVELYGTADAGLAYTYQKNKYDIAGYDTKHSSDTYGLESGNLGASKWGLKGSEDLGNGYAVSFKLENGFSLDTGTLSHEESIYGREASLTLSGPFGAISAGRMGALTSGAGTYDIFQAYADVFDGGVNLIGAGYWRGTDRYNNSLVYVTPDLNGAKVYAQYSFSRDSQEDPSSNMNRRYWGVGTTYDNGPLGLVAVVDSVIPRKSVRTHDSIVFSLGGHYDFGSFTPYVGFQYGRHMTSFGNFNAAGIKDDITADAIGVISSFLAGQPRGSHRDLRDMRRELKDISKMETRSELKGWALSVGSAFDLPCGTLQASVYYAHAKGEVKLFGDNHSNIYANVNKHDLWGFGLVHAYPLSKRTAFYSGLGANYSKTKIEDELTAKSTTFQALVGLNHNF